MVSLVGRTVFAGSILSAILSAIDPARECAQLQQDQRSRET